MHMNASTHNIHIYMSMYDIDSVIQLRWRKEESRKDAIIPTENVLLVIEKLKINKTSCYSAY